MMDIGVVFFGHKRTILDIKRITRDLGNHICQDDHTGSPLQSCGFSEFGGHICFFPGEVWQVSAEVSAVRGFGVDWAVEL